MFAKILLMSIGISFIIFSLSLIYEFYDIANYFIYSYTFIS